MLGATQSAPDPSLAGKAGTSLSEGEVGACTSGCGHSWGLGPPCAVPRVPSPRGPRPLPGEGMRAAQAPAASGFPIRGTRASQNSSAAKGTGSV